MSGHPMTINPANIKAGDKVQLEFTVVKPRLDNRLCFQVSNHESADYFVLFGSQVQNFEIVGHTPAPPPPWVPKAGDIFRVKGSLAISGRWEILCLDPDGDWVARSLSAGHKSVIRKTSHYQFELDSSEN